MLTLDDFTALVGDEFTIGDRPATLVAATPVGEERGPGGRIPFSLEFVAPGEHVLAQAIYPVTNAGVGTHEIFLVPIATDADGVRYEAVFT